MTTVSSTGTLNFAIGDTVKYISVPVTDDSSVESTEQLTITLSTPFGLALGTQATHTLTITDDDSPVVTITATDASAVESGDAGQFTLTRTGPTTASLDVNVSGSGTSTSGTDYSAIATLQTIPAGQSSATVNVSPLQDIDNEGAETVILAVQSGSGYVVGSPASATVTIADDDRSTVTITANDASASESAGNSGQFTVTRTAPTNVALTVSLAISGTATNTTDYATVAGTLAFAIDEESKTIDITPVDDGSIEGPEVVTIALASGSYDIGASSFASVTIADNDNPPAIFITSPTGQGAVIAATNGIILSASVTDDGVPAAVTQTWSLVSGPGTATIESPNANTTAVTFSTPGTYIMRISATDTQFTVSDQVTIVVGSSPVASNWLTQDMAPSSARRGQSLETNGIATVTGTGAGYASSSDSAHVMVRPIIGNGSVVARLTSLSSSTALSGVTIRDSLARGCKRVVLGDVPGFFSGLQFRTRSTNGITDAVTTTTGLALPLWLKLERDSATNFITGSYSTNGTTWTSVGTTAALTLLNTEAHYGLTTTSNSTASTAACSTTWRSPPRPAVQLCITKTTAPPPAPPAAAATTARTPTPSSAVPTATSTAGNTMAISTSAAVSLATVPARAAAAAACASPRASKLAPTRTLARSPPTPSTGITGSASPPAVAMAFPAVPAPWATGYASCAVATPSPATAPRTTAAPAARTHGPRSASRRPSS